MGYRFRGEGKQPFHPISQRLKLNIFVCVGCRVAVVLKWSPLIFSFRPSISNVNYYYQDSELFGVELSLVRQRSVNRLK